VQNTVAVFPRDKEWGEVQTIWGRHFGVRFPDNKVTFVCRRTTAELFDNSNPFYVTFHDNQVYLGTEVRPYRGGDLPAPRPPVETD
jgi:hypothetical protein